MTAAKAEVDAACAELDGFPSTPATDALRAGAAYLVSDAHRLSRERLGPRWPPTG